MTKVYMPFKFLNCLMTKIKNSERETKKQNVRHKQQRKKDIHEYEPDKDEYKPDKAYFELTSIIPTHEYRGLVITKDNAAENPVDNLVNSQIFSMSYIKSNFNLKKAAIESLPLTDKNGRKPKGISEANLELILDNHLPSIVGWCLLNHPKPFLLSDITYNQRFEKSFCGLPLDPKTYFSAECLVGCNDYYLSARRRIVVYPKKSEDSIFLTFMDKNRVTIMEGCFSITERPAIPRFEISERYVECLKAGTELIKGVAESAERYFISTLWYGLIEFTLERDLLEKNIRQLSDIDNRKHYVFNLSHSSESHAVTKYAEAHDFYCTLKDLQQQLIPEKN